MAMFADTYLTDVTVLPVLTSRTFFIVGCNTTIKQSLNMKKYWTKSFCFWLSGVVLRGYEV